MTTTEVALTAFSIFNSVRVAAYLPQLIRVWNDKAGAAAVPISTWTIFTLANTSTATYALINVEDATMAVIFGVNAIFSFAIVAATMAQRRKLRHPANEGPLSRTRQGALVR